MKKVIAIINQNPLTAHLSLTIGSGTAFIDRAVHPMLHKFLTEELLKPDTFDTVLSDDDLKEIKRKLRATALSTDSNPKQILHALEMITIIGEMQRPSIQF